MYYSDTFGIFHLKLILQSLSLYKNKELHTLSLSNNSIFNGYILFPRKISELESSGWNVAVISAE